jgi:hypothetical protein
MNEKDFLPVLILFLRFSGLFLWGGIYALWLQLSARGKFLVRERTYITVIIGTVVVLFILFAGNWDLFVYAVTGFFTAAIGIIIRSWHNEMRREQEQEETPLLGRNKSKWFFEDTTGWAEDIAAELTKLLENGTLDQRQLRHAARARAWVSQLWDALREAQRGNYDRQR